MMDQFLTVTFARTSQADGRSAQRGTFMGWELGIVGLIVSLLYMLVVPPLVAADTPLTFNLNRFEDRSGDFPLVFYTFHCGSKRYTFCPPAAWKITGDATSMSFSTSTSDGDAAAHFRISSAAELALLNPDQSARRISALRQNLPAGITGLEQVGLEDTNPAPVLGHKGVEIAYRFDFFGHALKASVMICQLDEENGFTLVTIAPAGIKEDFIDQVRHTLGAVGVAEDNTPNQETL